MARKDKLSKVIRDEWPTKLDAEMKNKFGITTKTEWNVEPDLPGQWITRRVDGHLLTISEASFIHGYMIALNHVFTWNGRV